MNHHSRLRGVVAAAIVTATVLSAGAGQAGPATPNSVDLARAFTSALNAHDVDAVVALFTEEDSGPTVNADRYAWQKYEIRLWAEQQAAANVRIEAYDYRVSNNGATWRAQVSRDDFGQLGIAYVSVTNSIWVYQDKLADFTSTLDDPSDAARLGGLWQPGTITTFASS